MARGAHEHSRIFPTREMLLAASQAGATTGFKPIVEQMLSATTEESLKVSSEFQP